MGDVTQRCSADVEEDASNRKQGRGCWTKRKVDSNSHDPGKARTTRSRILIDSKGSMKEPEE